MREHSAYGSKMFPIVEITDSGCRTMVEIMAPGTCRSISYRIAVKRTVIPASTLVLVASSSLNSEYCSTRL
jgi:hypothetical protein